MEKKNQWRTDFWKLQRNAFHWGADEVLRISLALIVLIVSVAPRINLNPDQIAAANNSKAELRKGIKTGAMPADSFQALC